MNFAIKWEGPGEYSPQITKIGGFGLIMTFRRAEDGETSHWFDTLWDVEYVIGEGIEFTVIDETRVREDRE